MSAKSPPATEKCPVAAGAGSPWFGWDERQKLTAFAPRLALFYFGLFPLSRAKQTVRNMTLPEAAKINSVRIDEKDEKRVLRIHLKAILPDGTTIVLIGGRSPESFPDGSKIYPKGTIFRLRTTHKRSTKRKRRQVPFSIEMIVFEPRSTDATSTRELVMPGEPQR